MEIKIGIAESNRELVIDSADELDALKATIANALNSDRLELTDSKGRVIIVPSSKIAYVELAAGTVRSVGFISH